MPWRSRGLIGFVHNLLFLGDWSFAYDFEAVHVSVAVGGAGSPCAVPREIGVTFIVSNFAPEAKGHGVPEK